MPMAVESGMWLAPASDWKPKRLSAHEPIVREVPKTRWNSFLFLRELFCTLSCSMPPAM